MNVIAVIPTLNEEKGIGEVISGFRKVGVNRIIVIDGGSNDKTTKIAQQKRARVISVPSGKGNAFRMFLKKENIVDNAVYVMIDGDASYKSSEVHNLLNKIKNYDVVSGQRKLLIYDFESLVHVIANSIASLLASLLFFKRNPDVCTGYWAFKGKALKKLAKRLTAKNFDLEVDIFANACKLGLKQSTVAISYSKRKGQSKIRPLDTLIILKKLLLARIF